MKHKFFLLVMAFALALVACAPATTEVPAEPASAAEKLNIVVSIVPQKYFVERMVTPNGGFNPHIWLSPALVKIQSETIYKALVELDPAHEDQFKANLDAFLKNINALDAEIRATLEKTASKKFIVFHPAWGYFARADAAAKKIAIVHENDKFSTDVVTALEAYAIEKGYEVVLNEGYDSGTTDFAPIINKIPADVDAIMGGGHFADGQQFAKALSDKGVAAKFISLLVAPPEPTFAEIGDAAFGIVGPSQWEPLAAFAPDYGPTGAEFIEAYKAAFGEEPSYREICINRKVSSSAGWEIRWGRW